MNSLLEWLLDLDRIRLARDAPLLLKWNAALPAWLLFGCGLIVLVWIGLMYRQERGGRVSRIILGVFRVSLLFFVGLLLCQPSLVLERNRVEPSHVVLLMDTSASMGNADEWLHEAHAFANVPDPSPRRIDESTPQSRLRLIQDAMLSNDASILKELLKRQDVQFSSFAAHVEPQSFTSTEDSVSVLVTQIAAQRADGTSTDLAGALIEAVEQTQGRRVAAIVVASDGQSTEPTSMRDAIDLIRGRQVPVFPIRVGSPVRPRDVEIIHARTDEYVYVHDKVAVDVQLKAAGFIDPTRVTLRLVDVNSGEPVVSGTATLPSDGKPVDVELHLRHKRAGQYRYRVEVVPLPRERVTSNNQADVVLDVIDDRARVLFVEGYPRYEYRYLKNALLREESIELRALLLEADRDFVQEGIDPIRGFPETKEELNGYDVVIFGDVDPRAGWLTQAQMRMLVDFVGNLGGGFALVAGERSAPHRFRGTPLERLIPVRLDPAFYGSYESAQATGFRLHITSEGQRSRLFRYLSATESSTDTVAASSAVFEQLPDLFWVARTLGAKPGATVLAEHPTVRGLDGNLPVVVEAQYGAGKVLFQATDDTWRWRRHTGELLHDTYWVQVVRELMRNRRGAQDRRFVLRTDQRSYAYGVPVHAQVEVSDPELLMAHPEGIELVITASHDPSNVPPLDIEFQEAAHQSSRTDRGDTVGRMEVRRLGEDSGLYEGTYLPERAGTFTFWTDDLPVRPGEVPVHIRVRVTMPDLEARRPEADHETLERLAEATGGKVLELEGLDEGLSTIEDRSVQIPDDLVEPLWDSKLAWIVFVGLITTEWVMRKLLGMM